MYPLVDIHRAYGPSGRIELSEIIKKIWFPIQSQFNIGGLITNLNPTRFQIKQIRRSFKC